MQYENIRVTLDIQGGDEEGDGFTRITGLDHGVILTESVARLQGFLVDLYGPPLVTADTSFMEKCNASLFITALDVDETGSTRLKSGIRGDVKEVIADFLLGWLFVGERGLWIERVFGGVDLVKRDWVELILVYMYKLGGVFQNKERLGPMVGAVVSVLGVLFWNGGCDDEQRLLEVCGKSKNV
jgi:hypothetical protein